MVTDCWYTLVLFNLFVKYSYVPANFMQSTIVPLVKNKSGNLSDIDNYRAIAISAAVSKVFESVILSLVHSDSEVDQYQFGFKKRSLDCSLY